jgi:hypothetical protein
VTEDSFKCFGWASISKAAVYAGVSPRTIRNWMKMGLKYIQVNGKTKLIRYSDIDDFLDGYSPPDPHEIKRTVDDLCKKVVGQN